MPRDFDNFPCFDFHIHISQGDYVRNRCHFVLRGKHHVGVADWILKAEFLELGKAFFHAEFPVAVDARVRDGFVEGHFR